MKISLSSNRYAVATIVTACLLVVPLGLAKDEKEKKSDAGQANAATAENPGTFAEHCSFVGVSVEPLHPAFAAHIPHPFAKGQGLLVVQVAEGSPAEKAGLKTHDILMTFGDQKLFSHDQLSKLVQSEKVGNQVKFTILREGKPQGISVTLGDSGGQHALGSTNAWTWRTPHYGWRLPEWFTGTQVPQGNEYAAKDSNWSTFDSLTIQRIGDHRFHVEIGYLNKDRKVERQSFEGTLEEIHKDIAAQKDLPAIEREHLFRSLDMSSSEFPVNFSGARSTSGRQLIWGFPDGDLSL